MKRRVVLLALAVAMLFAVPVQAQYPPGEGPRLGPHRITQAEITSGTMSLSAIRRVGMELFSTPFNKYDGFGDGPYDPADPAGPTTPGHRPTLQGNGTWLRVQGLDSQSCLECHAILSSGSVPATFAVGGAGGMNNMALGGATVLDVDDSLGNGYAFYNGRSINPPFVFGAGGVELVGKEMTVELQAHKATALAHPGTTVDLIAKGVYFGTISYDVRTKQFNTSDVEGIDDDLVVRPFGRKGDNSTIRKFDTGAMQFHFGMQPSEVVGDGVDDDDDGVADEILPGELSALHIFSTSLERPIVRRDPAARYGPAIFKRAGCGGCHVPIMNTRSAHLPLAFPEVETDPAANVYYRIDLRGTAGFKRNRDRGVSVRMFSDLKRHDMGPDLAEATGAELDSQFITARLWGIADSGPYLHDGRALTLTDAILMHGGEAQDESDYFASLPPDDQLRLIMFLRTLRTPRNPSRDLLHDDDEKDDGDDDSS